MLRVRLLGDLEIELDGSAVEPPASRRARALLAWLALDRRMHPRSRLAARFWPDVLDESARTSLRSALSALRRSLGQDSERYLIAGREDVGLADDSEVWTDVAKFERHGITADEALARLRRQARNTNHTLGDVAEAVTLSYPLFRAPPQTAELVAEGP